MGTSTLFRRLNDLRTSLADMSKADLEKLDKMSPWGGAEKEWVGGWSVVMELHNGNFNPLVWWYGRLIRLKDAPKLLTGKYYHKYSGKYSRSSEWTLLRKYLEAELKELDKEYQKELRARRYKNKKESVETQATKTRK